jgi:NAD(P)-dependent dehydrogenase (short-subunit alcohol dehydrogenase family)
MSRHRLISLSHERRFEMDTVNGARVVVTGPTSGIGKEIVSQLASRGAEVILACRDVERGKQIAEEIADHKAAANPRSSASILPATPRSGRSLVCCGSAMTAWTCL